MLPIGVENHFQSALSVQDIEATHVGYVTYIAFANHPEPPSQTDYHKSYLNDLADVDVADDESAVGRIFEIHSGVGVHYVGQYARDCVKSNECQYYHNQYHRPTTPRY